MDPFLGTGINLTHCAIPYRSRVFVCRPEKKVTDVGCKKIRLIKVPVPEPYLILYYKLGTIKTIENSVLNLKIYYDLH